MNRSDKPVLSKSTFVRGCKCLKSLHLYKHQFHLRDTVTDSQQAIFDQGHEVGKLAQKLFPGGVDCSVSPAWDYARSTARTRQAIDAGSKVIYEAGFAFNKVFAAVDILVIKKGGWHLYEVKSSTEVKDYHHLDAAIQYYILKGLGLPVKSVNIVTINNQYIRNGPIDPQGLFNIENVTTECSSRQPTVAGQLEVFFNTIASATLPEMEIGPQCEKFYSCDFEGHCWKKVNSAAYPVHTISRIGEKKWDLLGKQIYCQSDIPATCPLSVKQRTQVHGNKTGTSPEPDREQLISFLGGLKTPLAFLDFETVSMAIPPFDGCRPYQQLPFQYSIHLLDGDRLEHVEFLGDAQTDPREALASGLIEALAKAETILCYSMSFEKSRLEELKTALPHHATALDNIIQKLQDLIVPFRNHWVYDHRMNGSASIKKVLPALLPHLRYDALEINEGGAASQAYAHLQHETDVNKIAQTRAALLEYCKMDTYAMVALWQYLQRLCFSKLRAV